MRGHSLSAAVWWEPKVPLSHARTLEHEHCDLESDRPIWSLEHLQLCLTCSLDDPNSLGGLTKADSFLCLWGSLQLQFWLPVDHHYDSWSLKLNPTETFTCLFKAFLCDALTPRVLLPLAQWSQPQRKGLSSDLQWWPSPASFPLCSQWWM